MQHPVTGIAGTKSGLHTAVQAIVLDALTRGIGQTLTTNGEFRERLGVGAGTLQRALDLLAERGALQTTSRGHLGRRIESVNIGDCWQAAGLNPVRFIFSMAGPVESDVLEEVLATELTTLGIPYTVYHSRGGNGRLESVSKGEYDIAIVSSGTLNGARETLRLPNIDTARVLAPGTYYAPERLVVLRNKDRLDPDQPPRRIAIDRESFDHEALTVAEFPESDAFDYVEMDFTEVPGQVLAGLVDAGVWHITTSAIPLFLTGLSAEPMSTPKAMDVRDSLSAAAAVAWNGRPELKAVLATLPLSGLESGRRERIERERRSADALASAMQKRAPGP